jgi:hypothetical protein
MLQIAVRAADTEQRTQPGQLEKTARIKRLLKPNTGIENTVAA